MDIVIDASRLVHNGSKIPDIFRLNGWFSSILLVPEFWLLQATVKIIVVCSSWGNNYISIIFDEANVALSSAT